MRQGLSHIAGASVLVGVLFALPGGPAVLPCRGEEDDGKAAAPSASRFVISFSDGSRLVCRPVTKSIPIKTSYASIDIPLDQAMKIAFDRATTNATVQLKNGDQLRGGVALETIDVKALLGNFSIALTNVDEISVMEKPVKPVEDTPQARDRCINNLRQIDASKEQYALEHGGAQGTSVSWESVALYVKDMSSIVCPLAQGTNRTFRGSYKINPLGTNPECMIHKNHRMR